MRIFIPGKTSLYIEKGPKTHQFLILFLMHFHPWVWYFPSVSFYLTKGNGNTDQNNFEMIVSIHIWLFMKKLEIADRWSTRISPADLKNWNDLWPWPLTWKWYATHCFLMGCICATYQYNPWKRQWATERTRHRGRTDGVKSIYPPQLHCVRGIKNN